MFLQVYKVLLDWDRAMAMPQKRNFLFLRYPIIQKRYFALFPLGENNPQLFEESRDDRARKQNGLS